jgi:thiamine biosynthesis lipoprotein ApbE
MIMKKYTFFLLIQLLVCTAFAQNPAPTSQDRETKELALMKQRLNLTATQQKKMVVVLKNYHEALQKAYADTVLLNRTEKVKNINAARENQLVALLDSVQRTAYKAHMDSIIAAREKRYKKTGN